MSGHNRPRRHQRGAALLAALLTVALVATLASAGLWQQWRAVEVEAAERQRAQAAWVLAGALDWARLILREDGVASAVDHAGEPWAVPLREARLATFLDTRRSGDTAGSSVDQTFLSGEITDLQGRLNLGNLIEGDRVSPTGVAAFSRLFAVLGLPESQVQTLASQLLRATRAASTGAGTGASADGAPVPLLPQDPSQLGWLGLPPATVATLAPHVSVLPGRAPVNLNTASSPVVYAVVDGIGLGDAQRLVSLRASAPLRALTDAAPWLGPQARILEGQAGVASRHFEVRGRLRMDATVIEERSLLQRDGGTVRILNRQRVAWPLASPRSRD